MYEPKFIYTDEMVRDLLAIEHCRAELEFLRLPTRARQELAYKARLKRTHFSTSIEGNVLSYDQVERVITEKSVNTRVNAEREVLNYWDALTELERLRGDGATVDTEFIKHVHDIIVKKTARPQRVEYRGATRPGVLFAVFDSVTREVEYIPPEWSDIPALMEDLVGWYQASGNLPVPVRAAILHYQLATIHPFDDGNGRTSRALATYALMENGYDFKGFNSMEEYYASDLTGYYESLQMGLPALYYDGRCDPPHLEYWIEYFVRMMALNAQSIVDAARAVEISNPQSKLISALNKRDLKMLRYVLENRLNPIKTSDLADVFKVTTRSIRTWCTDWVDRGLLETKKGPSGRVTSYSLAQPYASLTPKDLGYIDIEEEDA